MQTLWTRVAQSRCSCNCSTCVSSASLLARRSTTAAAGRRLRFGEVFTLFYSSMLATAAVVDSHRKDVRREVLDKAIAQAKNELKDLESQQQRRLAALSIRPSKKQIIEQTKGEHWGDVFAWATRQREWRQALGFQDWKGVPLDLLEELPSSEIQDILADSRNSLRSGKPGSAAWDSEYPGRPLSQKKLRTLELSVAKMILRILSQISNDGLAPRDGLESAEDLFVRKSPRTKQDLSSAISNIDERLSELQRYSQTLKLPKPLEYPQYPRYSVGPGNDSSSLNATLRFILNPPERSRVNKDSMLAKLCYKLLISTTPPDVRIYNMILDKFCNMEEQDLVYAVLGSMRESHIRPNEITHSIALKFYTTVKNRSAFANYVRLMEGLGPGLAVAHPKTARTTINLGRYRFPEHHQNPVAQFARSEDGSPVPIVTDSKIDNLPRQTKIIEKARMNVEVYGALIHGALRLFGKEQAMQFYRAMISDGWEQNIQILTSILRHCCYKEDWPSGVAVWQEIQKLASGANEKACIWMLRLCRRCQQQNAFEAVLSDGTQRGVLPKILWDFDSQITTARVDALLDTAKRINALEVTRTSRNLEPSIMVQPAISAIPDKITLTEYLVHDQTATALRHQLTAEEKERSPNARPEPISLEPGPVEVPALFPGIKNASIPQPTPSQTKKQTQQPPSNLPIAYPHRRALPPPQIIPDQSFWERHEQPVAATA